MARTRPPLASATTSRVHVDKKSAAGWTQTAQNDIRKLLSDRTSWYYSDDVGSSTATPDTAAAVKKLVFDKKGVRGYSLSPETARKKTFVAHGVLRLALEDIAYALYCDDTAQQRLVNAFLDHDAFLDAAVLDVFEHRSAEDPFHFAGVKWAAYNAPPGVVTQYTEHDATTSSDFVYFEYSCKTRDADGHVVLVQYVTTHPHMAPSGSSSPSSLLPETFADQSAGLARGSHVQISTYRFMDEGTQYKSMGSLEVGKSLPAWASMKAVLQACNSVLSFAGLADARAVSSLGSTPAAAVTKTCNSCKKKFGLMRARLNCHACGQCVCKNCTLKLKFFHDKVLLTSRKLPLLSTGIFCLGCVRHSRDKRPERGSFCQVSVSVSSEESNTTVRASADEVLVNNPEDDFWDLHDEDGDLDEYPTVSSRYFDRFGGLRPAAVITPSRVPADTKQAVASKTSTRGRVQSSSSEASQRQRSKYQQATPAPKPSPVEVFLARAKTEQQRAAEEAAASRNPAPSSPQAAPSSAKTSLPTEPDCTGGNVFDNLSKSLAEQEKLLQSIQEEAHKLRVRAASGELSSRRRPTVSTIPENARFEVVDGA